MTTDEAPEWDEAKEAAIRWVATMHPDETREQHEERLRITVGRAYWPRTCREAARCFARWAKEAPYGAEALGHRARAEILAAFGEADVPQPILDEWDFQFREAKRPR